MTVAASGAAATEVLNAGTREVPAAPAPDPSPSATVDEDLEALCRSTPRPRPSVVSDFSMRSGKRVVAQAVTCLK
ncbi:hypothetical protein [Streptomyces brasiliensis]|uniref:Uncharacterized protein n=1 Tax=Streptomyces brasiliensis TaxID=1954 RepID=A0A917NR49_9ACTN|nr:hypothetical protein [Streptomyces brasiliensis]GGJ20513.1 hypothetical protein GCM10010121_034400 [Streptomyces brasiliensis]